MSSRKKLSVEDQIVYRKFRNRQDITYIAEQVCVTEDFARNVILEELLRRYGALEIEKESMEEVCERCEVNYEQVREYPGYEGHEAWVTSLCVYVPSEHDNSAHFTV